MAIQQLWALIEFVVMAGGKIQALGIRCEGMFECFQTRKLTETINFPLINLVLKCAVFTYVAGDLHKHSLTSNTDDKKSPVITESSSFHARLGQDEQ